MKQILKLSLANIIENTMLLTVSPKDLIRDVACKMTGYNVSAAAVLDSKGYRIGIITEHDIVKKAVSVYRNVDETTAEAVMARDIVSVPVKGSVSSALARMSNKNVRHLPVMNGSKVVGIVDVRDLYGAMNNALTDRIQKSEEMLAYAYGAPYSVELSSNAA